MGGALRKVGVYLGLVEDQGRYDEDAIYDDDFENEHDLRETRAEPRPAPTPVEDDPVVPSRERERTGGTVAPFPERRQVRAAPEPVEAGRITTLHPRTYNDARLIGEHFRDGTPVIMNLTDMDDADAKRLVDFAAGLIFGLRGSIDRVTARVFLLSPANVTVRAEEKARMAAEGGFFNQS